MCIHTVVTAGQTEAHERGSSLHTYIGLQGDPSRYKLCYITVPFPPLEWTISSVGGAVTYPHNKLWVPNSRQII